MAGKKKETDRHGGVSTSHVEECWHLAALYINLFTLNRTLRIQPIHSFCCSDQFEAQTVRLLLRNDRDIIAVRNEVKNATTMVITPYRAQVNAIKKLLDKSQMLTNVKIDTVDRYVDFLIGPDLSLTYT